MNILKKYKKYVNKNVFYHGYGGLVIDIVKVKRNDMLDGLCYIKWNKQETLCFKCVSSKGYYFYLEIPKNLKKLQIKKIEYALDKYPFHWMETWLLEYDKQHNTSTGEKIMDWICQQLIPIYKN